MLSPTSLLHNSMIFNRNNTVATQQGMKTYWLWWINSLSELTKENNFLFSHSFQMITHVCSRSYRLTTCRARCITAQGRIMSTTGTHNHPPHVKNSSGSKVDATSEHSVASSVQPFVQQMSNQIQNMPSTSATVAMINQHQMSASMNFTGSGGGALHNNNFSMTNILNSQISDMDPNSILTQSSTGLSHLDSNVQITPIINASIENLQMQQQIQRNSMSVPNMHIDIAITSANNWFLLFTTLYLSHSNKNLRNEW